MKFSSTAFNVVLVVCLYFTGFTTTVCFGQVKKDSTVTVTDSTVIYEVPMAYELMHIAMALTDTTIEANGYRLYNEVINTKSAYYKAVMLHFSPFKNHPLVQELNKALRKSAGRYLSNLQLAYNCVSVSNGIVKEKKFPLIHRMAYRVFSINRKQLNDFAKVTGFASFYLQHRNVYQTTLNNVQQYADVNRQKYWLEKEFPRRYARYNIVVSPLMGGTHFTKRYQQNGNYESVMWVSAFHYEQVNALTKALYTGVVMTEIDHGYVNPVSNNYKRTFKTIMGKENRIKWAGGGPSNSYKTGYKVFNEYMTHAAYLLFSGQQLTADDWQSLEKSKIFSMENNRKFINFGSFYATLKALYTSRKSNETIADLYPAMIEWCKKENSK